VRAALLAERPPDDHYTRILPWLPERIFPIGDPPDYEPGPERSAAGLAAASGRDVREVMYDLMLGDNGRELLMYTSANYADGDGEAVREMLTHPLTVLGASDAGAHCGVICDASMPTSMLTHWVRDRTRGPRLPLEQVVHWQTADTARAFGITDRGVLAPGWRADVNVIDLDGLRLARPEMVFDLPGGHRRLIQRATGYAATLVAGEVIVVDGADTAARPGKVGRRPPVTAR
jgi:N-acyl-D-aspartate/D-glutamate deacylase